MSYHIMPESERFKRDKLLRDLERAVLAACAEEERAEIAWKASTMSEDDMRLAACRAAREARIATVRDYVKMLDTKAEGKEA